MTPDAGSGVEAFAQTNLELFDQLAREGYDEADLALADRAHAYARELFSGAYRGSGKPFLCHLVGTASVLVSTHAPTSLVAAGLLHAAYHLGDFGAGWLGRSEHKRSQVRARMGTVIEDLIERYTLHEWDTETPTRLLARLHKGEAIDREVTLIRLANEVDEHLDLGILYCRDADARLERLRCVRTPMIELAHQLAQPRLGAALETVFAQSLSAIVPAVRRTPQAVTFWMAPASRTRWRMRRLLAMLRERG